MDDNDLASEKSNKKFDITGLNIEKRVHLRVPCDRIDIDALTSETLATNLSGAAIGVTDIDTVELVLDNVGTTEETIEVLDVFASMDLDVRIAGLIVEIP